MGIDIKIIGQVPKDDLVPDNIEDSYRINKRNGIVVISDGASESYDSKTLSELICSKYLRNQRFDQEWIKNLLSDYSSLINVASLSWSKELAYKRGSFATLLALKEGRVHGRVNLLGIGDSFVVLIDGERIVKTFPYKTSSQFQQHPELISTIFSYNTFITKSDFNKKHKDKWDLEHLENPIILLMTDSLGEWMLRNYENKDPIWKKLIALEDCYDLKTFVHAEWNLKKMRKDDITLIKIIIEK